MANKPFRELTGDIQTEFHSSVWDAYCCTTNTRITRLNCLVMGKGIALIFKNQWPWLPEEWGRRTTSAGKPHVLVTIVSRPGGGVGYVHLVSFPTKEDWRNPSSLSLIERSAKQLQIIIEAMGWRNVLLPRPGCANGGLSWNDVRPVLLPVFDDRITIITKDIENG